METDVIIDGGGQRTQVGLDLLDYVLRYAAGDYDCYHQGRYIGSRPTLAKAIEAIEYEQAKSVRHPQGVLADDIPVASYQDELRVIAARLQHLAYQLARPGAERASMRAQLILAQIRITRAIKNVQEAERCCALAERAPDAAEALDAAA